VPARAGAEAPTLLKNASFEIDAEGAGMPDHWTLGPGAWGRWKHPRKKQLAKVSLDSTRAAAGKRSVKVAVPTDNEGKYWNYGWEGLALTQAVPTKPDTVYTLSLKVYNEDTRAGNDGDYAFVRASPALGAEAMADARFIEKPSDTWIQKQCVFRTGRYTRQTVVYVMTRWNIGTLYFDEVSLVEGGELTLSDWDQLVPDDRLLPVKHVFARPDIEAVKKRFEEHHQASEKTYRGDGSWEDNAELAGKSRDPEAKPLMRATSQRVHGYLGAYAVTRNAVYLERAAAGLDYIVKEQRPDGVIESEYYETGGSGVALGDGYQHVKDERHLEALKRVAEYVSKVEPHAWNLNYNTKLLRAACAYARITSDPSLLLPRLETKMLRWPIEHQAQWGGWPGHNSKLGYHCDILETFANIYEVLPGEVTYDALRNEMKRGAMAALNRLIVEQQANGGIPYLHGQPGTTRQQSSVVPALMAVHEVFGWDEARQLLYGAMTYISTDECGKYYWLPEHRKWLNLSLLESEGLYIEWAQTHPAKD
jgi:hypothetical protein